jgi:hypothetical protein
VYLRKLNLTVSGVPLVDTKAHPKYHQERRGPDFIFTHSNTRVKKDLREQIGKKPGKTLRVEVIPSGFLKEGKRQWKLECRKLVEK